MNAPSIIYMRVFTGFMSIYTPPVLFLVFQVSAVREGMGWIVPVPLLSLLTALTLEQMVCGMPEVSIPVLKKVVR